MGKRIFITGGTGYMGGELIPLLLERGHQVRAVARKGSESKIQTSCEVCTGNVLDGESYREQVTGRDTFIHLVGVPHPSPAKAREFVAVDLRSAQESIRVARSTGVQHFIYVSVAHPAPVMKVYIDVRTQCEELLRASGLNATIVRPWYVLGPGHRWPVLLKPLYRAAELVPSLREGAQRLGLVNLKEMIRTLVLATESPAAGVRIVEVPEIRRLGACRLASPPIGRFLMQDFS
jgi:uncharacterized protein YbjT (DUF2867 family)